MLFYSEVLLSFNLDWCGNGERLMAQNWSLCIWLLDADHAQFAQWSECGNTWGSSGMAMVRTLNKENQCSGLGCLLGRGDDPDLLSGGLRDHQKS